MKFVFEVRIKPGHTVEEYADAWVRTSELIQRASGARGTRLHRKLTDPTVLLAIAEWDSKADRDAADGTDPRVREIIATLSICCEIAIIGEFDDPEWIVLPESRPSS